MTYGSEAGISFESRFPTLRIDQFNIEENNHLLLDNLDVAEERREVATIKMAYYQQKLKQRYDRGVSWVLTGRSHIKSLPLLALGPTIWKIWMKM